MQTLFVIVSLRVESSCAKPQMPLPKNTAPTGFVAVLLSITAVTDELLKVSIWKPPRSSHPNALLLLIEIFAMLVPNSKTERPLFPILFPKNVLFANMPMPLRFKRFMPLKLFGAPPCTLIMLLVIETLEILDPLIGEPSLFLIILNPETESLFARVMTDPPKVVLVIVGRSEVKGGMITLPLVVRIF